MYLQYGVLYLILTRPKFAVCGRVRIGYEPSYPNFLLISEGVRSEATIFNNFLNPSLYTKGKNAGQI